jgi:putative glutamine amidotransferase
VAGLLLTGGGDVLLTEEPQAPPDREMDRDRDFWEAALFEAALKQKKPVLGVCRGVQLMNVFLGGTLWEDIPSQCPGANNHQQRSQRTKTTHQVILEPDCMVSKICGQKILNVNSGHHQAVRRAAEGFQITGHSPDGIIEVMEYSRDPKVFGVQWHPESLVSQDPAQLALFEALVGSR